MLDGISKYIGQGLIYPITLDNLGKPLVASGTILIESNLKILLSWPAFTRFYLSEYGSRIEELLEEPNDLIVLEVMRRFVILAITRWEKRVSLIDAEVFQEDSLVSIKLTYLLTNTDLEQSFVFPFYEKINT